MRVLVYEPDGRGHRFQYVRFLVESLSALPIDVTLVTSEGESESDEFNAHIEPIRPRISLDFCDRIGSCGTLRRSKHRTRQLQRAMNRLRPDHVYVPYADGIAQVLGAYQRLGLFARRARPFLEGLIMRGRFAYPTNDGIATRIRNLAALCALEHTPFDRLHWIDHLAYDAVIARGGPLASRSDLIPDPVEPVWMHDRRHARASLSIPLEGRYIGCIGVLDERKGIHLLLRAFANAQGLTNTDRLLLVGRLSPPIRQLVTSELGPMVHAGRLIVRDAYATDEDLNLACSAMDVACALYPRHIGSSSVLIRAAAAGRFVLGSNYGWIGATIEKYGLGLTCSVTEDPTVLSETIEDSLDMAQNYQPGASAKHFLEYHSVDNFGASWSVSIRQRLGLHSSLPVEPGKRRSLA